MTPQVVITILLISFLIFIIYLARKRSKEGFELTREEKKNFKLMGGKL